MKLRYHLLILAAIAVATVILFPLPFFITIFVLAGEGVLYGWWVLPSHVDKQVSRKRRGHLDR